MNKNIKALKFEYTTAATQADRDKQIKTFSQINSWIFNTPPLTK